MNGWVEKNGKNSSPTFRVLKQDAHYVKLLSDVLPASLEWCEDSVAIGNRQFFYFSVKEKENLKKVSRKTLKAHPESLAKQVLELLGRVLASDVPLVSFDPEKNLRVTEGGERLVLFPDSCLNFDYTVSCKSLGRMLEPFVDFAKQNGALSEAFLLAQDLYAKLALNQLPAVKQILRDNSCMTSKKARNEPSRAVSLDLVQNIPEMVHVLGNDPLYKHQCVDPVYGEALERIVICVDLDCLLAQKYLSLLQPSEIRYEEELNETELSYGEMSQLDFVSLESVQTTYEIETVHQVITMGVEEEEDDFFPIPSDHIVQSHTCEIQTFRKDTYRVTSIKRKRVYSEIEAPWEDY